MKEGYEDSFPLKRQDKFTLMLREATLGWSDQSVARKAGYGISTITRWKTGARNPSLQAFEDVLNSCGHELVMRKKHGR